MQDPMHDPMDIFFGLLGVFEVAVLALAFTGIIAML
jgi:hypothetical protein